MINVSNYIKKTLNNKTVQLNHSEQMLSRTEEQYKRIQEGTSSATTRLGKARELTGALKEEIAELEEECQAERSRIRKWLAVRLVGESLGDIDTKYGVTYREAKISGIEKNGLTIQHSRGRAFIPSNDLPKAYRDKIPWEDSVLIKSK